MRIKALIIGIIAVVLLFSAAAFAGKKEKQNQKKKLVVAVSLFEPFIMKNGGGHFYGFDVDLWKAIADELGYDYEMREVKFKDIFDELKNGKADVAISGISMTSEREKNMWFSYHYMDSGLKVMVRSSNETDTFSAIGSIWNEQNKKILFYFITIVVLGGAHVFWLLERGINNQIDRSYFAGILDSIYFVNTVSATVGFGDITPKRKITKMFTTILFFVGILFFSYLTAQLSSAFTVQKLESNIIDYRNLGGKLVATEAGTTSVDTLKRLGARVVEVDNMQQAYAMLLDKKVTAVVSDAPQLYYYEKKEGAGKVVVVGDLFDKQYYAIALQKKSPLRNNINQTLLKFRENGVTGKIYRHWLGDIGSQ